MKFDSVNRIKADEAVELMSTASHRLLNEEGLFDVYNKIFTQSRQSYSSKKEANLVQQTPRTPTQLTSFNDNSFDSWPTLPSTRKNSEVSIFSRNIDTNESEFRRPVDRLDSDAESRITEIVMIPDSPHPSPDPLNLPNPNEILADHASHSRTERTPFNWRNNDGFNPTYVGLSREQHRANSSAFQRVRDYTASNYSKIVETTASAAERVTNSFGSLRNRVRVPNIRIPGPSILDNQYYSNLRMVFIFTRAI